MPLDKITLFDEKSLNHISRPFRNLIINGGMHIHQKGISKTDITTSDIYTADRWIINLNSTGVWTNSIQNDGPLNTGIAKSFKLICTQNVSELNVNSYIYLQHQIDGQSLQILKKGTDFAENFTLSFWIKSNFIGKYVIEFIDSDNNRNIKSHYLVNTANTWERKIITIPGDKVGILKNTSEISFKINFWLAAGEDYISEEVFSTKWENLDIKNSAIGQINLAKEVNNYFQITGVQMEIGLSPTNFEILPINIQKILNS